MKTEKICKGTNKAIGHGCGQMVPQIRFGKANRVYGLGIHPCKCYQKWLFNSDEGKKKMESAKIKAKKTVENTERKVRTIEKRKMKIALMSTNKYRSEIFQPKINLIARLIDFGHPCMASGNYGKENGEHYISQKANVTIAANLHNVHIQSFESNHFKSGDVIRYQDGIKNVYGKNYMDYMDSLRSCPNINLTKIEYQEKYSIALKIVGELKKDNHVRTPLERIQKRNQINQRLGIYEEKYALFWHKEDYSKGII